MIQLPQYINYEPGTKVPVSPTGVPIDPHDSSNWMTHEAAVATGRPIGFVLTEADPYFLLDIDKQRDPITGVWSDLAAELCEKFADAGKEISQSGNGLHIIGTCDQRAMADRRNKWTTDAGVPLECYTSGRYVAFGGGGFQGDLTHDCTSLLLDLVPVREGAGGDIPDIGPVPEWSGPTDDSVLVERMLRSRGSVAVQFGDKASVNDLWTANADQLGRFFPSYSPDDPFDRSSADAALMSHLAFWTGKDMARMDRLFRQSGLMRAKYEKRRDYRQSTIRGAAGACVSVLTDTASEVTDASGGGGNAVATPTGEYLTTQQQVDWFKDCIYIVETNRIMVPGGWMLDRERFTAAYGGREFQMSGDGTRPTRNAWEAFTQNRAVRHPMVRTIRYTPFEPFGAIRDDAVNVFQHPEVPVSNEPVDPFLDLLGKVLPDERDRRIFLTWCAAMVQSPGVKFQWSIVLQGAQGNGKTFLLKCMEQAMGPTVTHLPNPEDMEEKYNDYIEGNLLIGVEEIHTESRRSMMDRLKKYITSDRIEVRAMNQNKRMCDNLTNWMFLTNHRDAIPKGRDDRRYAVFFTGQQEVDDLARDGMTGRFFPDLWKWARSGGFAAVAGYLKRYEVDPEFDPRDGCHRAPKTSTEADVMAESIGPVGQEILELIESEVPGFRGGWVSSVRLAEHLTRKVSPRFLTQVLSELGYRRCSMWKDGRSGPVIQEGNVRPRLYCTEEVDRNATSVDDYLAAQGYL